MEPNQKLDPGTYRETPNTTQKLNSSGLSPRNLIRTMKGDVAEAIKKQNETSVSIAIAEREKVEQARTKAFVSTQEQEKTTPTAPKRLGRVFIVVAFVLFIAIAIIVYLFILPKLKTVPVPAISIPTFGKPSNTAALVPTLPRVEPLAPSILPTQTEKRFNITKETPAKIFSVINTERGQGAPSLSIKNFYFAEEGTSSPSAISANRFLGFANIQTPEIITRSLEKPFMVGFFGEANGGTTPFMVFKVSGYDTGLAGMLEWEAGLPHLFETVFGSHAETTGVTPTKFHDAVISGRDARLLEILPGSGIAYAFANTNTIVISESTTSLAELLLLAEKN